MIQTIMTLDKILVTVAGIAGIVGTYWFFFLKREKPVEAKESIEIRVDGGYKPSEISLQKGKTTTLTFFRTDSNTCLEEILLSDFKIRQFLPLNKKVSISITPKNAGTHEFTCGMNMFHGKLIVT